MKYWVILYNIKKKFKSFNKNTRKTFLCFKTDVNTNQNEEQKLF